MVLELTLLSFVGVTLLVALSVLRVYRKDIAFLTGFLDVSRRGERVPRLSRFAPVPLRIFHARLQRLVASHALRIREIERERDHLQTIIRNMREGVILVGHDERIVLANAAASEILSQPLERLQGFLLPAAVLNADLQAVVRKVLDRKVVETRDVVLLGDEERFLRAYGRPIEQPKEGWGALLVLNDVTRLTRLENVRRDFVANVSHELRTPITSIKGFIETLAGGSVTDPADVERFLQIANRQVSRLHSIVEDLLSLSKLEEREKQLEKNDCNVRVLLELVVESVQARALEKELTVSVECDEQLVAYLNASLIQQAVVNLVDNAVTYSNPQGIINVRGMLADGYICVSVQDFGCGMDRHHLPRIWERFYRVDKARSRRVGGTGLGLAIVKHIVQLHGGRVQVESSPGQGSTFSMFLPAQDGETHQLAEDEDRL